MPASFRLGVILERRAVVEDPAVVDEEHVAGFEAELDVQSRLVQDSVQRVERPLLVSSQWLADLLVTGLDPVTQIAAHGRLAVPMEDRERHSRRIARSQSRAALDVERLLENHQSV